jgi:hypothetical protein
MTSSYYILRSHVSDILISLMNNSFITTDYKHNLIFVKDKQYVGF